MAWAMWILVFHWNFCCTNLCCSIFLYTLFQILFCAIVFLLYILSDHFSWSFFMNLQLLPPAVTIMFLCNIICLSCLLIPPSQEFHLPCWFKNVVLLSSLGLYSTPSWTLWFLFYIFFQLEKIRNFFYCPWNDSE